MTLDRQWGAGFAAYFSILGLWTAFGPSALMATSPQGAPLALAAITLGYFVATPLVRALWRRWGFARTLRASSAGVAASLCAAALWPQWLACWVPLAFFCGTGSYMLCETQLLEDLARAGQGHRFGRARKWGSFGFLAAAALGGAALSLGGVGRFFTVALALCGLAYGVCCLRLARAHAAAAPPLGAMPQAPAATTAPTPAPQGPAALQPDTPRQRWLGATAVTTLRLAEAISTTWFGAYWLASGHGALQTGLLCALPVAAEFVALWKGGRWLARYSGSAVMLACAVLSALRWLATPSCSQLWCAVPLQALHAFTFGFFYPASLIWLQQAFGAGFFRARYACESAARALTAAVSYLAAAGLIAHYGYHAIYGLTSALALLSGLWWLRVWRRAPSAPAVLP